MRVLALEEKTDDLEQYSRRNTVRVRYIPEALHEHTDGLVKDMAARKLDVQLSDHDIVRSHRYRSEESRPGNAARYHPSIYHPQFEGRRHAKRLSTQLFINEELSKVRSTIALEARTFKWQSKIADSWTRYGTVFVKVCENSVKSFTVERLWKIFKDKL